MDKEDFKLIPSKGTRLQMMVALEGLVTLWAVYALVGQNIQDTVLVFNSWADFTKWNVGIYAASETVVKGSESVMNR